MIVARKRSSLISTAVLASLALHVLQPHASRASDHTPLESEAETTLQRLSTSLQTQQHLNGEWIGPIEADVSADIMPLILSKKLGLTAPGLESETLNRVFKRQDPRTGLWSEYPGGPPSLDVTGMVLKGLEVAGIQEGDPRIATAWHWFRAQGGIKALGTLSKMISVFADIVPADSVPNLSTKFFALPKLSPINIFNVGFGRSGLIPLAVWRYYRDARTGISRSPDPLDPKRLASAGNAFGHPTAAPISVLDPFFRLLHFGRQDSHRFFETTMSLAEDTIPTSADFWAQEGLGWILKHQQPDGTWAGALQITYFCMFALHEAERAGIGHFGPQIQAAWRGILGWRIAVPGDMVIQQATVGPVMDTARVLTAFAAAPERLQLLPKERSDAATQWLLKQQLTKPGDWLGLAGKVPPGGWTFEYWNDFYPDSDDTGMVIEALAPEARRDPHSASQAALDRGIPWLLGMQNSDGGFPTWDRGTSKTFNWIAQSGVAGVPDVADVSQGDITSRVLKGLAVVRWQKGVPAAIDRACAFMLDHRVKTADSKLPLWQGEWMVDYTYGTAQAIDALMSAGCWTASQSRSYVAWLIRKQQPNGGWGESPESYLRKTYIQADPTLTQTEFVLTALIRYESERLHSAVPAELPSAQQSIDAGIRYLVDRIGTDEFPFEQEFTGVYVRGVWYGRYLMLPHYEAVRVLGAYLRLQSSEP